MTLLKVIFSLITIGLKNFSFFLSCGGLLRSCPSIPLIIVLYSISVEKCCIINN